MLGSNTNLVTTVIGFGMSATFIVFVCTRIICGRLRGSSESHNMFEFEPRMDIEQPEHLVNRSEPVLVTAIPTMKFNREAFSSSENTQLSLATHLQVCDLFGRVQRKRGTAHHAKMWS
ncbi:uncharacterized protein LOC114740898 isoform X2 [Neltuma alba]|uniref:uncharacterized protein LOC114726599 isoform X2 n=1 Tax=Neltuma alba TaxID=207710 RepID=UPI0010A3B7BA|nr:uncharacterized protein LOC114726599 isoform X2 [Prosopis alba]XP_028784984.1 uncharacterized protein LOC114740898 isoform X2 [Prosopis alba]